MRNKQATSSTINRSKHIFHKKTLTYESVQKKRRNRRKDQVAQQIKHYQSRTDLLLLKGPFQKLVREVAEQDNVRVGDWSQYYWSREALECLQWAAESYLVAFFIDTNRAATHAKRITIRPDDFSLIQDIRS